MRNSLLFKVAVLLAMLCFTLQIHAQEAYNMPKKDGKQPEKVVSSPLLFYDMGGPTGNNPGYYAGYTRFLPANDGEQVSISFRSMDLSGNSTVYIYDGDISFTAYSSPIPEGYIAKLSGNLTGDFVSSTGSLSVLYHCAGSGGGAGWEANVESIIPKTQEWKSISATAPKDATIYPGKCSAPLMMADAITEGNLSPLSLQNLTFNLNGTISKDDLSNIKVIYSGTSRNPVGEEFGSTVSNGNSPMSFNGNVTLKNGHNYFWLIADVLPSAKAGQTISATLSSSIVDDNQRISNPITAETSTLANIATLSTNHQTYTIGETPLSLYDDGGPDNNITEKFEGSATFIPSTPGKKVRIRFTKLDLFNTSSTGLNDVLKIYNGSTTDDSNLIATILKEVVTVHSTASDGSITIYLKSVGGITKPGFEAIVEEFTPRQMEIESIVASHPDPKTFSAGDSSFKALLFNLKTVNTEPAITPDSFKFSTGNSTASISKASLFFLGDSSEGNQKLLSSIDNPQTDFSISPDCPISLSECDNWFLLTVDAADNVTNGQMLDIILKSAVLSGTARDININPDGEFTADNVIYSRTGSFEKTISGEWRFENAKPSQSYYGYDETNGDQIITLIPASDNKKVSIDFSKFELSHTSYYNSPIFKIFDGRDVNSPIIWEATATTFKTGPQKILRATNAEGVLTVLFNTNSNRGSSGAGFIASISEYESRPMAIDAIFAQTATTDIIKPSEKDAAIIGVNFHTSGDLNPIDISDVTIDLKNSNKLASTAKVFHTGTDKSFNTGKLIGQTTIDKNASTAKIAFTEPLQLEEGDNYIWVAYDINDVIESDKAVDTALVAYTSADKTISVDSADPEGERLTKNIYLFQGGNNEVTVDGSMLFYDDGGADGKYTSQSQGTITFTPTEGKIIRITINEFNTFYSDYLYVYNGKDADESQQAARLSGSTVATSTAPIVSKADDGSITLKFEPKRNGTNMGWEMLVEAFVPQPLRVTEVNVTPVNDIKMLRGSQNNAMLKMEVTLEGDKGSVDISKFKFDSLDSDSTAISKAEMWATDTYSTFNTSFAFGEETVLPSMEFSDSRKYDNPGKYYFWLSYDISTQAASGSKVQAKLISLTANTTEVIPADENQAMTTVQDGVHGTFSIGTSGDYDFNSISDAIRSLDNGIDGPVIFQLEDGIYKEAVLIGEITGTSEINTITLRSKSGKRDDVVITYDIYRDPGSSNYSQRYGIFTLDGIDWFTLEGVTISAENATTFPGLLWVRNKSTHNTIRNCLIKAPKSLLNNKDSYLVNLYSLNEANCNNDFFTLENSTLDGGWIGISLGGTGYVALPKQRGGRIINNTFINQGSKSIYINNEEDAVLSDNTIISSGDTGSSYYAMDIYNAGGDMYIERNSIAIEDASGSAHGIYYRPSSASALKGGIRRIINNEINISGIASSSVAGIRINNMSPDLDLIHNTIRLRGDKEASAIFFSDSIPGGRFVNNLIMNETGGKAVHINREAFLSAIKMSNNMLFTSGNTLVYLGGNEPKNLSFDQWKDFSGDDSSYGDKVSFLSDKILEPAEKSNLLNAIPVDYISTDLYGALRDKTNPTIGAYEYAESSVAPNFAEGYPEISSITYESAVLKVIPSLTSTMRYVVMESNLETPTLQDVIEYGIAAELRKGKTEEILISGLSPKTEYKVYAVLQSLRGIDSDVIDSEPFTTSFIPTSEATFEDAVVEDSRIYDGTASFTGFAITEIEDGVGDNNSKAAEMEDSYAVILLTNASGLPINGFFAKNTESLSITVKDENMMKTASKIVEPANGWHYINLRDMGLITYIELESDGDVFIDNFAGLPLPLDISIPRNENEKVTENEQYTILPLINGGVAPFTYEWRDQTGNTICQSASLDIIPASSKTYRIEVTDALGTKGYCDTKVRVRGNSHIATFDDLYLHKDSYWMGNTEDEDYMTGSFFSGSYEFNNYYNAEWNSWAFFGYSNKTSTQYTNWMTDQFNSAVGSGVYDSANYGVAYVSDWMGHTEISFTDTDADRQLDGMWITNTAWVVDAILNGDGMSEGAFDRGDYLTLTLRGVKADGTLTDEHSYYLADYRAEDEPDRWYLDSWQWIDLKPLGEISRLRFGIFSTKRNQAGITTPTYVCIDNVGDMCPVTLGAPVTLETNEQYPEAEFSLLPYFTFDPEYATVKYEIDSDNEYARLDNDNVIVSAKPGSEFNITVHASQRGKNEYVNIPVKVDILAGVRYVSDIDDATIYPNPASTYFYAKTGSENFNLDIFSISGTRVATFENLDGNCIIDITELQPGSYVVVFSDCDGNKAPRKLIVK